MLSLDNHILYSPKWQAKPFGGWDLSSTFHRLSTALHKYIPGFGVGHPKQLETAPTLAKSLCSDWIWPAKGGFGLFGAAKSFAGLGTDLCRTLLSGHGEEGVVIDDLATAQTEGVAAVVDLALR